MNEGNMYRSFFRGGREKKKFSSSCQKCPRLTIWLCFLEEMFSVEHDAYGSALTANKCKIKHLYSSRVVQLSLFSMPAEYPVYEFVLLP